MLILPHRLIQVAVFEQLRAQLNGWLSFVCALEKQLCCNLFWTYIFKPMKTVLLKSTTIVIERHVKHMCMQT